MNKEQKCGETRGEEGGLGGGRGMDIGERGRTGRGESKAAR